MPNFVFAANLLLFLSCFASPHHASSCNKLDLESLLSVSFNLEIVSSPLNWSSAVDCCLWEGIHCNTGGRVTHLWLPERGISGSISPYLGNLTYLSHLNLSHNLLSGPLPSSFFSLALLDTLDLSYNRLSDALPSSLPLSSNIKIVDLSSNHFHGEIQSSFFQLAGNLISFNVSNNSFTGLVPSSICINASQSVWRLDFSFNDFGGQIPLEFGECSNLQVFRAGFNNLSGQIPNDIYNATALQEISVPANLLSGPIGDNIIHLTNLKILELYSNSLIGLIPEDIGKLLNLQYLFLHINNITGSLPPSLMNCTNLIAINLGFNFLQGDLSVLNFSTLLQLRTLDLGKNNFTGRFPPSLYSCKSLTTVRLAGNQLKGEISPDILALEYLSFFSLSSNQFENISGAIRILSACNNLRTAMLTRNFLNEALPDDENLVLSDGFQKLQILGLGGCQLTGQVPRWLAKLKKLQVLNLSGNQLTGSLPGWLGNLQNLFYVDLSDNLIFGKIPKELCKLLASVDNRVDRRYLELPVFLTPENILRMQLYNQLSNLPPSLYLRNNSLSGNIPIEIGQLKFLHVLDISHNNFSGNIPDQISELTNLERLDLSGNHLTGEIPASLIGLHFLSLFNVSNNNLQGPIPSGGQFDTFPCASFEGNSGLSGSVVYRSCTYQPTITHPALSHGSLTDWTEELCFALIAGAIFGFIIGSTSGLLFPISKLKSLFLKIQNF